MIEGIDTRHITRLADRIETRLAEPFILTTGVIHAGWSTGTAIMAANDTANAILKRANHQMYTHERTRRSDPHRSTTNQEP